MLAKLPSLEVADLSFCIYLEAATSMDAMAAEGFKKLRCLDLRWVAQGQGMGVGSRAKGRDRQTWVGAG